MMELLSPAGSRECLRAAVQNGADAVYFGGSILNARRFADNFTGDEMISALDYCHERGVRAYVTLNTLVFDREINEAVDFAGMLYRYGADAVLVQDIGLLSVLRNEVPELTIHASTQMGIHDIGGLRYLESIGVKRAVLAREVSLDSISALSAASRIELEAFGHGALCMGFSGSCLYSSMAGERSGNRGTCAQPCRKPASVFGRPGKDDFCLSPGDICMIEHLAELERAGICCIKLEGRMKKPEYVAAVTRCYREALDGADRERISALKSELFAFFNRGEFNTSHFFSDSVRTDRIGSSKPDKEALSSAKNSISSDARKRPAELELSLKIGEPSVLTMRSDGKSVTLTGAEAAAAVKPQNADAYLNSLRKLGDTPFAAASCKVFSTPDCYVSSAELNALRRAAADRLAAMFRIRNELQPNRFVREKLIDLSEPEHRIGKSPFVYSVVSSPEEAVHAFLNGADAVGIEPCDFSAKQLTDLENWRKSGKKLLLVLPNVLISGIQRDHVSGLLHSGAFDGAEANNIGQTELISNVDIKIAGIGLNALNTYSVSELIRLGYDYIVPSQELTSAQLEALHSMFPKRLILWAHGRVPLMHLLHCPVREHRGCRNCTGDAGFVTDEDGRRFPLSNIRFPDKCLVRMLNCNTTDLVDLLNDLPVFPGLRLSFIGENDAAAAERLNAVRTVLRGERIRQLKESTRCHLNRKVD